MSDTKEPEGTTATADATKAPETAKATAKATKAGAPESTSTGPQEIPDALLKRVQRPKVGENGRVETTTKKQKVDGEVIEEHVPVLRPIARREVLAWAETEDEVVVVTVDGQKYTAAKGA